MIKSGLTSILGVLLSVGVAHASISDCRKMNGDSVPPLVPAGTLTTSSLNEDIDAFLDALSECWANRATHESIDGYTFMDQAAKLKALMQGSESALTASDFFGLLIGWEKSLHDGHLSIIPSSLPPKFLESPVQVRETQQGLAVVSCDAASAPACVGLKFPALIERVNDLGAEMWLSRAEEVASGSTLSGRRYHAIRELSFRTEYGDLADQASPRATLVRLRDSAGVDKDLGLNWHIAQPAPAPLGAPSERQCVHPQRIGTTWVLKIDSFACSDPSDFADHANAGQSLSDLEEARLERQLNSALSNAPAFGQWMIDLRDNGGGYPKAAEQLLGFVLSKPWIYYKSVYHRAPFPAENAMIQPSDGGFARSEDFRSKPLWVLGNGGCFSQCYLFARALKDSGRARFVGQELDGGEGGPTPWVAPSGGWTAMIPVFDTFDSSGAVMEGTTVHPDLPVLPSLSDIATEPDAMLTAAVRAIEK